METLYLIILLTIGAVLLAFAFYKTKGSLLLKCITVAFFFFLTISVYATMDSYKGWPTSEEPNEGRLISIYIVQDEAFYLWIKEDETILAWFDYIFYKDGDGGRLYVIPWDEDLLKSMQDTRQKLMDGWLGKFQPKGGDIQEGNSDTIDGWFDDVELMMIPPEVVFNKDDQQE